MTRASILVLGLQVRVREYAEAVGERYLSASARRFSLKARTPYQRLLDSGILTEDRRQQLAATYVRLNPISLLKRINENLEDLWTMAERPNQQQRKIKTLEVSVT